MAGYILATLLIHVTTGSPRGKVDKTFEFTKQRQSPSYAVVPAIIQKHQSPSNGKTIGIKPAQYPLGLR
jgi:hypothetical protein